MFKLFIAADKPEGCEPIQTYLNNNFRDLFHIDKKNVDEAILLAEVIYHRPDFIFFDIERPKLSVLKVAAQIRTYLPDCKMVNAGQSLCEDKGAIKTIWQFNHLTRYFLLLSIKYRVLS